MRATTMTPEELRAAGIYLNAGRRRGWRKRLALLLDTPEATIAAWATRAAGNARPIPGVAAVGVRLLAALLRAEVAATGDMAGAARRLAERVTALTRPPAPTAPPSPVAWLPIRLEPPTAGAEALPMAAVPPLLPGGADLNPRLRRPAPSPGADRPPRSEAPAFAILEGTGRRAAPGAAGLTSACRRAPPAEPG